MKSYVFGLLSTQLHGRWLRRKTATLEYHFSWSFSYIISLKTSVLQFMECLDKDIYIIREISFIVDQQGRNFPPYFLCPRLGYRMFTKSVTLLFTRLK